MKKGHLFVLSGPSGVGKNTIEKKLRKAAPKLKKIISYTTRRPRPKEKNKVHYVFVPEKKFRQMMSRKAFLEWAKVHNHYYGTPKQDVIDGLNKGYNILLQIDVQGARNVKKEFPKSRLIFLMPESIAQLKKHLEKRGGMSGKEIALRLKNASDEMKRARYYDFKIVNEEGKINKVAGQIASFIKKQVKN